MTSANGRVADHPIDERFLQRWSPRSFSGESVSEADLMTLFEAARWAPSSYNSQPWRFIYALRDTPDWEPFLGLLNELNRSWCGNAGALVFMLSKSTLQAPGQEREIPSYSHSFDAGAAWGYLALQASMSGLATHAMVGFDMDTAFAKLQVPQGYRIETMIAVGRRGDRAALPDALRAREEPNGRKPIASAVMTGRFIEAI